MSIELKPSRNYPGRTALHHKTHPDANMATIIVLTPEDIKELVQALTEAGHIKPQVEQEELTVYGYCVIGSEGESCLSTDVLTQQDAIDRAAEWSKDAKNLDIGYSYKVAAIVDQGGL